MTREPRAPSHVIPFPGQSPASEAADPRDWDSLKRDLTEAAYLALVTARDDLTDESDRLVIADENAFRARFGFDRPRRDREHLIQLKHDLDLTDREIRGMQRSGSLAFDVDRARLNANRWVAYYGRLMQMFMGLMGLQTGYLVSQRHDMSLLLLLKLVGVSGVLLGMGYWVHRIYIWPWQIQRRARERG